MKTKNEDIKKILDEVTMCMIIGYIFSDSFGVEIQKVEEDFPKFNKFLQENDQLLYKLINDCTHALSSKVAEDLWIRFAKLKEGEGISFFKGGFSLIINVSNMTYKIKLQ
jgi:hypothetical protein